jgi:hypothetical protein
VAKIPPFTTKAVLSQDGPQGCPLWTLLPLLAHFLFFLCVNLFNSNTCLYTINAINTHT